MNQAYQQLQDKATPSVFAYRIYLEPPRATHQSTATILRTRDGRTFIGKKSNSTLVKWRKDFENVLRCCKAHAKWTPFDQSIPLAVEITSSFPMPKSGKTSIRWKITKPDLDNHAKTIIDAMTSCAVIFDDSQIAVLHLAKEEVNPELTGVRPSIEIIVRQLFIPRQ